MQYVDSLSDKEFRYFQYQVINRIKYTYRLG